MVYKIFQGARATGQSAAKALSHNGGSLFAASQSGYSAANNPLNALSQQRRQRASTKRGSDIHKHFSTQALGGSIAERVAHSTAGDVHLDAYLSAWKKHPVGEREWKQFHFPKTINGGSRTVEEAKGSDKEHTSRPVPSRVQSSNAAAEHTKNNETAEFELNAIETVNKEIAATIAELHRAELSRVAILQAEEHASTKSANASTMSLNKVSASQLAATLKISTAQSTTQSSASIQESELFAKRLSQLREVGRFDEIPAVFESMLRQDLIPTANAYNALIAAAYQLPVARHQVIPKVLDVYSDMLKRGVMPNKGTYTLMLEIMAVRSLEVVGQKRDVNEKKVRYAAFPEADHYLLSVQEAEMNIQADDDVLALTSKIFKAATSGPEGLVFAAETYRVLLQAYAESGEVDQMLRVFSHMEKGNVVPLASTFAPMIRAFAKSGDLPSAVECYNEYKNLAIEDNNGKFSLIGRADNDMHAAVVEGYLVCNKEAGANKFFDKVIDSFDKDSTGMQAARNAVVVDALIKTQVTNKQFVTALQTVKDQGLVGTVRDVALQQILESAADRGQTVIATEAFNEMSAGAKLSSSPAMLVMQIRNNDLELASATWKKLLSDSHFSDSLLAPATLYAAALVHQGADLEALAQLRYFFDQLRTVESSQQIQEKIDSSLLFLGADTRRLGKILSGPATMSFVRAMIENRGPIPGLIEQLLSGVGPDSVASLDAADLELAMQVQSDVLRSLRLFDPSHAIRFSHMVDTALDRAMSLSPRTIEAVDESLSLIAGERADIVSRWKSRNVKQVLGNTSPSFAAAPPPPGPAAVDGIDPYTSNIDLRGSTLVIDELEKQGTKPGNILNEALTRFKNIRRAGRHPRYIVYAKLISAAAREEKVSLMKEIFEMAQQDVPLQPQYSIVRHGWTTILDSMVAACLTTGNRTDAFGYHQQLLDIGAAPSANTFGLYITTLKETKTFDEASEAVRIFKRAQAEHVEPSSFLYNALIGKLGKARRIDDCLFYFSEMRQLGIRPTSVTYGTIVNALCRVSDERFAVELFDEMESMPNYKPRPAPYNSMMQFFLATKRDSARVLGYYSRMLDRGIQPTMHTYKLLIDTYATLEPVNLPAAEGVLELIRSTGERPEPVHYASLIHAKGCALHDMTGARNLFDRILAERSVYAHSCLFQSLFEAMTANHVPMKETTPILATMRSYRVEMTPYIANTLIHGWATEGNLTEAKRVYMEVGMTKREPSTYEAMIKAYLSVQDVSAARDVVAEMLGRGYPTAVSGKVMELLGHASADSNDSAKPANASGGMKASTQPIVASAA